MQLHKSIGLYGAIIALSVGVLGVYGLPSLNIGESQTSSTGSDGTGVSGHVTSYVTAPDGRITTYRQSDNLITNQGADCTAKQLFTLTAGKAIQIVLVVFSSIIHSDSLGYWNSRHF